jgi:hypothetical protein
MPIEFKGFEKIKVMFTELDSKNDAYVNDVMKFLGKRLVELIKINAPEYTGEYKKSWKVLKSKKGFITVGLPDDPKLQMIFAIKEFTGIKKDFILPKNKKALHWVDPFTGEDVFSMYVVVTPEMKNPKPHFRIAVKQLNKEMKSIMNYFAQKHFKIAKFAKVTPKPKLPSGNPFGRV